MEKEAVK
jgi:hypothetical protein